MVAQDNKQQSEPKPLILHRMQPFIVVFGNEKVHGRHPIQHHTSEGCQFSSGKIVIDTEDFVQKGFESMSAMEEAMQCYGSCSVTNVDTTGLSREARDVLSQMIHDGHMHTLMRHAYGTMKSASIKRELEQFAQQICGGSEEE